MIRGRVLVAAAVVAGSLTWVAWGGLRGNLVYYRTPTELMGTHDTGVRTRLGGLVVDGSVRRSGSVVRFVVTDGETDVRVVDRAAVPQGFAAGKGVVLEGALGAEGVFVADTVLVKHDDRYQPPSMPEGTG